MEKGCARDWEQVGKACNTKKEVGFVKSVVWKDLLFEYPL